MLTEMDWKEKYRLGIPVIDDQHYELVSRINSMVIAINSEKSQQDLREMIALLQAYVTIHFEDEERLMEECGYDRLETHRVIHAVYRKNVNYLVERIQEGPITKELMAEVNRLLIQWLSTHIDIEDRQFAESGRHQTNSKNNSASGVDEP